VSDPADRTLADAVLRHRDERAFGVLYDRHTPYLYRFALRLLAGDEAAAQDAVHDAWVRAVERLAGFEWRSSLRTWLAGITLNFARAARRDDARTVELTDADAGAGDAALDGAYDRVDLERAIAALPAGARHVFVLHDVEGWTHDAIAAALGVNPGTSKSQLSRARALLRARLDPREGAHP
jgi:RNA polymerase sigma-70 factor (ECF subfamily)